MLKQFLLSDSATKALLSHPAGVSDILLAATLHSFLHAFPDRATPPAIFSDSHGREAWHHDLTFSEPLAGLPLSFPLQFNQYLMRIASHLPYDS